MKRELLYSVIIGLLLGLAAGAVLVNNEPVEDEAREERYYAEGGNYYFTNEEDYKEYQAERKSYLDREKTEDESLRKSIMEYQIRQEQEAEAAYREQRQTLDEAKELAEELYYDELELLAICVMAEAGGEDLLGKRLIVDVILNRVDDPAWPDSITGVITQPYEFSSYWDGGMDRWIVPSEECFEAVRMELEVRSYPGLYYFTSEGYSVYGKPFCKHGNHYFSTK